MPVRMAIRWLVFGPVALTVLEEVHERFASVEALLMVNHDGLSILVHPLVGDEYADRATFALWLGTALPLRLVELKASDDAG